jgi:hypothetical protein
VLQGVKELHLKFRCKRNDTVDAGGRATQLTNNGGWKNSFQCWADRMVFVRGDTTDPSYPLYVEILSLSED